jgi:FMN-dependent NADH-azoreductase
MSPNIAASYEMKSVTRKLLKAVTDYFKDTAHQEEFKKWHLKTYGVPYEFKKEVNKCETRKRNGKPKCT